MTFLSSAEGAHIDSELLVVEDLTVTIAVGSTDHQILDNVSLSVARGECLAVVGESGSGKSMTMRALLGLLPPTATRSGSIRFGGAAIDRLDETQMREIRGRSISLIPQDPFTSLNPVRKIGNQLRDVLRAHLKLSKSETREAMLNLVESVGLSDPAHRLTQYPHELSGGMRQRVAIAMALACGPSLLLADEPTTALDVTVQAQILSMLDRLRSARNLGVVLVTHDLGVVEQRADRVLVMYAGQVVESGPTSDVFSNPRNPYTKALLASQPRLHDGHGMDLVELAGLPPDPTTKHQGCRFAPRCPIVDDICRQIAPDLVDGSAHRKHRCLHAGLLDAQFDIVGSV